MVGKSAQGHPRNANVLLFLGICTTWTWENRKKPKRRWKRAVTRIRKIPNCIFNWGSPMTVWAASMMR